MELLYRLHERLMSANNIIITTHYNPDGDAIGSSLGLMHYLHACGKKATVIVPNDYPIFLKWMPSAKSIVTFEKQRDAAKQLIEQADLICCLDYNEMSRVGRELEPILAAAESDKIMIDHHLQPADFPVITFSDTSAGSTAEMVYRLLLSQKAEADLNTLTCLYTGAVTDTGNFQFSNSTVEAHQLAAAYIQAGGDPGMVSNKIFNSFSWGRLKFFGYCINRKLHRVKGTNAAYISATAEEMKRYNLGPGGTDGLVNYALKVHNVDIAAFFKEDHDRIKISFRSKDDHDVQVIAKTHFEGGGHKNAAGGRSFKTMEETIDDFIRILGGEK